uniref:Defective in cullin neddylation protein n=1 Tax=Ananas comosus var. bracteatus TaxID=296719 RepID=A0A6V7P813_ANACO|nr:unnamed protein product [Ananas comosus var. bracteatus]
MEAAGGPRRPNFVPLQLLEKTKEDSSSAAADSPNSCSPSSAAAVVTTNAAASSDAAAAAAAAQRKAAPKRSSTKDRHTRWTGAAAHPHAGLVRRQGLPADARARPQDRRRDHRLRLLPLRAPLASSSHHYRPSFNYFSASASRTAANLPAEGPPPSSSSLSSSPLLLNFHSGASVGLSTADTADPTSAARFTSYTQSQIAGPLWMLANPNNTSQGIGGRGGGGGGGGGDSMWTFPQMGFRGNVAAGGLHFMNFPRRRWRCCRASSWASGRRRRRRRRAHGNSGCTECVSAAAGRVGGSGERFPAACGRSRRPPRPRIGARPVIDGSIDHRSFGSVSIYPYVDMITVDGISLLCEDLQVDPQDIVMLVISWHMKAAIMCEFSRQEFIGGLQSLGIDSIEKFREKLPALRAELKDEQKFHEIYNFAFSWAKEKGQKSLQLDTAIGMWQLLFAEKHWPFVDYWCQFLQAKHNKAISRDTWSQLLEFVKTMDPQLSNYEEDSAWPYLIDEFVEYLTENGIVPSRK